MSSRRRFPRLSAGRPKLPTSTRRSCRFGIREAASGYTLRKLISLWLNGFTNFSVKPLRVVTVMGSLFAAGGFLFGLYVILQRLLIPGIQIGWSSMIAAITFMGGMILLVLGMVGEYIGRMFITMGAMPQYVVARRTGDEKPRE